MLALNKVLKNDTRRAETMVTQFWCRGRKCDLTALHFQLGWTKQFLKRHSSVPEGMHHLLAEISQKLEPGESPVKEHNP